MVPSYGNVYGRRDDGRVQKNIEKITGDTDLFLVGRLCGGQQIRYYLSISRRFKTLRI